MSLEYIYVKKLSELSDRITNISNNLLNMKNDINKDELETIKQRYNIFSKSISEYEKCKSILSGMIPPNKVKEEHIEIINAVKMFIDGTKSMHAAVNIDSCTVDKELMEKGLEIQKQSKRKVVQMAEKIAIKLVG